MILLVLYLVLCSVHIAHLVQETENNNPYSRSVAVHCTVYTYEIIMYKVREQLIVSTEPGMDNWEPNFVHQICKYTSNFV